MGLLFETAIACAMAWGATVKGAKFGVNNKVSHDYMFAIEPDGFLLSFTGGLWYTISYSNNSKLRVELPL